MLICLGNNHRPDRLQHRARPHEGGGGVEAAEVGREIPEARPEDALHPHPGCDRYHSTFYSHRYKNVTIL